MWPGDGYNSNSGVFTIANLSGQGTAYNRLQQTLTAGGLIFGGKPVGNNKTFTSSVLVLHSRCASCILNACKQCPYEATTSTRLNSHGSEERTQEDTMNPMRRHTSPPSIYELKPYMSGGT